MTPNAKGKIRLPGSQDLGSVRSDALQCYVYEPVVDLKTRTDIGQARKRIVTP
jgi:hypothetical protein